MKNIDKKILFTSLIILIFTIQISAANSQELKPGDVIGYAYYSDIVAYIDGNPIKTYNIGGHLAVIAGDLEGYGFGVSWREDDRTTYIYGGFHKKDSDIVYKPKSVPKDMVGKITEPVYYTDIKCVFLFFEIYGKEIRSFNVGGHTAVYLADLAEICADSYIWNSIDRTSNITLVKYWSANVRNENFDYYYNKERPLRLNNGFSLTFEKQPETDAAEFIVSESSGADYYVSSFNLSADGVGFSLYYNDSGADDSELLSEFFSCVNIMAGNGGRVHENTDERKEAVAKIFRIYINDKLVDGELESHQGNNTHYYTFYFDKHQSLDKVNNIRVEIGYK